MKKCAVIVTTYNRIRMLEENIKALFDQSFSDFDLYIVDNASTDGTCEMVSSIKDSRVKYYNTGKNLGGAGGFSFGIDKALNEEYEFLWIMDDDSIPEKNALESLIFKASMLNNSFAFLASLVFWTDGTIFPMNAPNCNYKRVEDVRYDLMSKYKIVPIRDCSFVGCFANASIVRKVGLPIADFFIYGDDLEFTKRMRRESAAFLDLDSVIIHKAPDKRGASVVSSDYNRINRFFFQWRNGLYIARKEHTVTSRLFVVLKTIVNILIKSDNHRIRRIWMVVKGTVSGFFYNPKIQYHK